LGKSAKRLKNGAIAWLELDSPAGRTSWLAYRKLQKAPQGGVGLLNLEFEI
jgi:hypothetical protein